MSEGISIQLVDKDGVVARVGKLPAGIRAALRKGLLVSSEIVLNRAKENVSGRVLKVQTGRLRQSLQRSVNPEGLFARVGTNVVYAARHEFGFRGPEVVPGHQRRITHAFGQRIRGTSKGARHGGAIVAWVRPFIRIANTPERPFMRPALADSKEEIVRTFTDFLRPALRGEA